MNTVRFSAAAPLASPAWGGSVASARTCSTTSNTSWPSWMRLAWTSRLIATWGWARRVA